MIYYFHIPHSQYPYEKVKDVYVIVDCKSKSLAQDIIGCSFGTYFSDSIITKEPKKPYKTLSKLKYDKKAQWYIEKNMNLVLFERKLGRNATPSDGFRWSKYDIL